jgi:hypothetical protein
MIASKPMRYAVWKQQVFSLTEGPVTIQWPGEISEDSYKQGPW